MIYKKNEKKNKRSNKNNNNNNNNKNNKMQGDANYARYTKKEIEFSILTNTLDWVISCLKIITNILTVLLLLFFML